MWNEKKTKVFIQTYKDGYRIKYVENFIYLLLTNILLDMTKEIFDDYKRILVDLNRLTVELNEV